MFSNITQLLRDGCLQQIA